MARFEYSYTDISDPTTPVEVTFGIHGVTDDVAKGVRAGLRKVQTVTNLTVEKITEIHAAVTGPDP